MRATELFPGQQRDDPNLQVVAEDDEGVTVSGMKMLATSAVFADEILIGNLTPIAEKFKSEAITAALPLNAPGLTLWARQPYAQPVRHEADYPLSYRFDETDSVLVCDHVKVPWERVFLHNDAAMSRRIYIETPANCYQNHQSNIRFWAKMALIVGVQAASPGQRHRQGAGGARDPRPARRARSDHRRAGAGPDRGVRGVAGGLRHAQPPHHVCRAQLVPGAPHRNRRHAAHAARRHSAFDAGLDRRDDRRSAAVTFERWWKTPSIEALERYKLYKLAWDIVGSEFAGRHMLYEKFYAGNSLIVRNQSDREAPWERFHGIVDGLLGDVEVPDKRR